MFSHFYHSTIRKYVVAFGTLFNNIKIEKPGEDGSLNKTHIRVPLSYAAKETYIRLLQENFAIITSGDDQGRQQWAGFLPRMSFEITNITYDASRKRNTMAKNVMYKDTETGKLSYTYFEVPYNIEFNLSILTRKIDDGLQIVEQIIPYFTPEFVVTLNLGEFAPKVDIPITLNSMNQTVEYEGESESVNVRVVTWDLVFTLRGYLYGPTKNSAIIKSAITEFFNKGTNHRLETVRADALDPSSPEEPPGLIPATDPDDYKTNIRIFGEGATDEDIFEEIESPTTPAPTTTTTPAPTTTTPAPTTTTPAPTTTTTPAPTTTTTPAPTTTPPPPDVTSSGYRAFASIEDSSILYWGNGSFGEGYTSGTIPGITGDTIRATPSGILGILKYQSE